MATLVLYALLTGALAYLFGHSTLLAGPRDHAEARWPGLVAFLRCPFCSGFWYGVLVASTLGWWEDLPFLGLEARSAVTPLVVGVCSIVTTPIAMYAAVLAHMRAHALTAEDDERNARLGR